MAAAAEDVNASSASLKAVFNWLLPSGGSNTCSIAPLSIPDGRPALLIGTSEAVQKEISV